MQVGVPIHCSYEKVSDNIWVCKVHSKPSKHKIKEYSAYPCLEVDPWTVRELDAMHERAGTYEKWSSSYKRRELLDKENAKAMMEKNRFKS